MREKKKTQVKPAPKQKPVHKEPKASKPKAKKQAKASQKTQPQPIKLDYEFIEEENKIKIKMHQQYQIDQQNQLYKTAKHYFKLFVEKEKKKNKELYQITSFSYFPTFQFVLANQKPSSEKCSICQFQFDEQENIEKQLSQQNDNDIVMLKCTHKLHAVCLKMLLGERKWLKCPVCSTIYGCMIGDQPNGSMTTKINPTLHCDGYPDCGTIIINYHIKSIQKDGITYPSTSRTAYLPDNQAGQQVLWLLRKAFDRKLIFTLGTSVTTGMDNQIVWNGIHHKTHTSGGSSHFGYPDDTYFDRLKLELAAKGVY